MKRISRTAALTALLVALGVTSNFGMTLNMATPWADKCSGPQTPVLAFYSKTSDDLLFNGKEPIDIMCQAGLRSVFLHYAICRNMVEKPFREGEAEAIPANRFKIHVDTAGLMPGFYDIHVLLDTGTGGPTKGQCTFGYRVSKMQFAETRPKDFRKFWDDAKAKIAKIPVDAQEGPMTTYDDKAIDEYNVKSACLPPDYDPTGHVAAQVESCKVNFAGPDGGRVYGWLAKPVGKGPFPVLLVLPGAGFNARPRPLEHARHGYLAMDIQIHGQDVDLPGEYPKLPGYYGDFKFDPVTDYYFYNIHQRVEQAINYLASRPDTDMKRFAVCGGSQGGRLSVVIAGMDSRVRAAVPCIAHSANLPYTNWAASCNGFEEKPDGTRAHDKPLSDGMSLKGAPPWPDTPENRCMAYYDPMNFAKDIHCPVMMNCGLIDGVSPPSCVWADFLQMPTKEKSIVPLPGHGHDWSAEFDRRAWKFLNHVWVEDGLQPVKKQ